MALPAPNLDDRRFQELVDDAKRLVQQRCPEWSDHNVSDPGVTLIELFAWMTDQIVYRLNRVPDRNYVKFLDLIGVRAVPADRGEGRRDVLALGAAGRDDEGLGRHPGLAPCAPRTSSRSSFETTEELAIPPVTVHRVFSQIAEDDDPQPHDRGRARAELLLLRQAAEGRRRAADRPLRRGALVRRVDPLRLRHRGPRRRPAQPAARLGGVGRRRLDGVRARRRRDRRPEPRRQRRPPRPAHARDVADQQPARRLAALPDRRGRGGPADLRRLAEDQLDRRPTRSAAPRRP